MISAQQGVGVYSHKVENQRSNPSSILLAAKTEMESSTDKKWLKLWNHTSLGFSWKADRCGLGGRLRFLETANNWESQKFANEDDKHLI